MKLEKLLVHHGDGGAPENFLCRSATSTSIAIFQRHHLSVVRFQTKTSDVNNSQLMLLFRLLSVKKLLL